MSFWDTIRGHELADILIRYLPKLAKREEGKNQTVIILATEADDEKVRDSISKGHAFRGSFTDSKGRTNVVLSD